MLKKINILLVDDVEFSRDLLRNVIKAVIDDDKLPLSPQFYQLSSGKDVLEIIENKHIDLVYLDIELPDMNGLDILKNIKKQFTEVVVVMVSGESSSANVMDSIKSGARGFLVKPFTSGRVSDSLRNYLKTGSKI